MAAVLVVLGPFYDPCPHRIQVNVYLLLLENAGEPDIVVVRAECLSAIAPASDDVIEPAALDFHSQGAYRIIQSTRRMA